MKIEPTWVCDNCAKKAGFVEPPIRASTYHNEKCDVCKKKKAVTEWRDFGYIEFNQE